MRRELLDAYALGTLKEARQLCREWRWDYNHERPHKALEFLSSVLFARKNQPNNEPNDEHGTAALGAA